MFEVYASSALVLCTGVYAVAVNAVSKARRMQKSKYPLFVVIAFVGILPSSTICPVIASPVIRTARFSAITTPAPVSAPSGNRKKLPLFSVKLDMPFLLFD